jgi:HD-like signal output (HDOD) protein
MQNGKSLVEHTREYLASNTLDLPVFHAVALKLQQILRKNSFSVNEVIDLISGDQALVSKVLRVANSPFYSGLSKISTIKDAVIRLGARDIANLTMVASQADFYQSDNEMLGRYMGLLWNHALGCATGTRWLATKSGYGHLAQEAFLAGLLHDIGKLFLLKVLDELDKTGQLGVHLTEALVREVLDGLHTEQGHTLMRQWNLPEEYCEVVRDHHLEECDPQKILLLLVRLTNLACRKTGIGMHHEPNLVLLATCEARILGVKEIHLAELEITVEDSLGGG